MRGGVFNEEMKARLTYMNPWLYISVTLGTKGAFFLLTCSMNTVLFFRWKVQEDELWNKF